MSVLNVTAVHGEPTTDDYGNLSYWVSIEGVDGNVLVVHKPDKPRLAVGTDATTLGYDRVEQKTSKAGKTYNKLARPAYNGGGGGGGRQRDPKESAQIQRQHSQEMALRYAAIRAEKEMLPEPFKLGDLRAVIDWFEEDIAQSVALRQPDGPVSL